MKPTAAPLATTLMPLTTLALAAKLKHWQLEADDVALVIGGPDGLCPEFKKQAHERIRLSDLTLPHAMVRVLLVEQLYRAWSVNAGHPYPDELRATAELVAEKAGLTRWTQWSIAWQSAGRTPEPWIGPDILEVIERLTRRGVVSKSTTKSVQAPHRKKSGKPACR